MHKFDNSRDLVPLPSDTLIQTRVYSSFDSKNGRYKYICFGYAKLVLKKNLILRS